MDATNAKIITDLRDRFCSASKGLEAAPFKLKWYNACLNNDKFKLEFAEDDSLVFVIISQPCMFENTFLPFVIQHWSDIVNNAIQDPLDQCMRQVFTCLKHKVQMIDPEVQMFHDFEFDKAKRRPKVLVQTAGHVSGKYILLLTM